jgi:hypothetical protein
MAEHPVCLTKRSISCDVRGHAPLTMEISCQACACATGNEVVVGVHAFRVVPTRRERVTLRGEDLDQLSTLGRLPDLKFGHRFSSAV